MDPVLPEQSLSSYESALEELLKLEFFGMKLGLQNITTLLEVLGRPDRKFPSIHIAGTNGKGSVASMLAAVFQADGKKVGLYTSPHLVDFRERIKVNGVMIPREAVRDILDRLWPTAVGERATFFEVTTALAFEYFRNEQVDIAIIETGLGGRLDATNVLESPLATVITSIGWDHMQQLGNTLESIAGEKAGIFKTGVPAIVNVPDELRGIFETRAREVGTELFFVPDLRPPKFKDIQLPLSGEHQEQNLLTVIETLRHVAVAPSFEEIKSGIEHVIQLTGIQSRLEVYRSDELRKRNIELIFDVGHNLDAVRAIRTYFHDRQLQPIVIVGLMKDKDISAVLNEFSQFAKRFVAVQAPTKRALESSVLRDQAESAGMVADDGGGVVSGVRLALDLSRKGETLLLAGSHYVIGDFLANQFKLWGVDLVTESL